MTTHPAFRDLVDAPARVYDLQGSDRHRDATSTGYWHGGDPHRNRINLFRSADQAGMKVRIRERIAAPLSPASG